MVVNLLTFYTKGGKIGLFMGDFGVCGYTVMT